MGVPYHLVKNDQRVSIFFLFKAWLFWRNDMTQRLKVVPSSVAYDIAGDYFQVLRNIIAPEESSFK